MVEEKEGEVGRGKVGRRRGEHEERGGRKEKG